MISAQEARNQRLQDEIRVLDKQIEKINDLEHQKQNFIARMQVIEKLQRLRARDRPRLRRAGHARCPRVPSYRVKQTNSR